MSVQNVNQHLRVIVGKPAAAADATAMAASTYGFISEGTVAVLAAPASGKNYQVAHAYGAGNVIMSGMIPAAFQPVTAAYKAAVQQVQTLTIPTITATGGENYILKVRLPEYGGTIGAQDEYFVYANYVADHGDDQDAVALALFTDIEKGLAALAVPVAIVTNATNVLTFTGVEQPYRRTHFSGKIQDFAVSLSGEANVDVLLITPAVIGRGTYAQVAGQEEFFAGYNEDYKNRKANWPASGDPDFNALAGKTYDSHTISVEMTQKGFNDLTQKQVIQIWEEK